MGQKRVAKPSKVCARKRPEVAVTSQLSLLPEASLSPAGLQYQPDFISEQDQHSIVRHLQSLTLQPFLFGAFEGKRRVASFGWRYDYSQQKLQKAEALPDWIAPLIMRVEAFGGLPNGAIRQVLVTEYEAGAGIGWHRDKPHFEEVFGLSLLSACRFRFRRRTDESWRRYTFRAEPRSLYLMEGESRHVWEHSIPPVEQVRYSVTFRSMTCEVARAPR
jgi:alkylated DNA repair dioxygenase AlkB